MFAIFFFAKHVLTILLFAKHVFTILLFAKHLFVILLFARHVFTILLFARHVFNVLLFARHVFEGDGWKSLDVELLESPHLVQVFTIKHNTLLYFVSMYNSCSLHDFFIIDPLHDYSKLPHFDHKFG